MKKVIAGKKYDTDTATVVGEWSNRYPSNDFKTCSETLYITQKGNWFLHGEGGAMSKYSESYGDSMTNGEALIAFTPDEAYRWLENNNDIEEIEKYFADRLEVA